ncbi:hypothetical protein CL6EHI_029930 [Entamoeba histolytica]|uniref:Uncharacterized protein n=3 Tax=Entamoeba histolytica TaxID=5759 RepID=B1N5K4_ENTH1|nr:hypothetical protein EHI_029930 [Entamoeba histolytica HM-1:IMSS]EDS88752.1 hypothetical protein EHI_029930 [Entamoeba histolytica HM-1:IMSS]EMD44778.1 Hypothetical protein EHI5A_276050 [Entamoeba histolytica KU27]GAT99546.1 hypothetical protein CL6EHI_029930 [Entamoeba histolytica]|eukprot:XP_001914470.1 hypothetical protein EHI_029930 [Entamoeba histolytica HM-1:IMSS]
MAQRDNCYDGLSDRFKTLFLILTTKECDKMNMNIQKWGDSYSFDLLFRNYEYYHFNSEFEYNIIEILKYEFTFILAIIHKVRTVGIESLSKETLDYLLRYIDDWCLRDGIFDAWDIAFELFNREEMEIELGLKKL